MDKDAWRKKAVAARSDLDPRSDAHCRQLRLFLDREMAPGRKVLIYDALPGEVDLSPLTSTAAHPTAAFAITRTPDEGRTLTLHPYGSPSELHPYGYRQPTPDAPTVADEEIGAVLVPALVFDRCGVRLGRGMGYYDRLLARLGPAVFKIGVTGGYVVESLPADAHDVAMTHLATPSGVWEVPVPAHLVVA